MNAEPLEVHDIVDFRGKRAQVFALYSRVEDDGSALVLRCGIKMLNGRKDAAERWVKPERVLLVRHSEIKCRA